jgi:hypothetical protein
MFNTLRAVLSHVVMEEQSNKNAAATVKVAAAVSRNVDESINEDCGRSPTAVTPFWLRPPPGSPLDRGMPGRPRMSATS